MMYLFIFVHRGTDYASKGIKVYFQQVPHSYYLSFSSKTFLNNFFFKNLDPRYIFKDILMKPFVHIFVVFAWLWLMAGGSWWPLLI